MRGLRDGEVTAAVPLLACRVEPPSAAEQVAAGAGEQDVARLLVDGEVGLP